MPAPHPRMHGESHRKGGPDPVPGLGDGIQFDKTPQEGGFLDVATVDEFGFIQLVNTGKSGFTIEHNAAEGVLRINSETNVTITADQGVEINGAGTGNDLGGDTTFNLSGGHNITILVIPTTAPAGTGKLWNDGGYLRIT